MYSTYGASIAFQGGKYGIGILSKEKPLSWKVIPLPGREEKRSLLIAEFKKYIFCCIHLSLTDQDRIASVDIINEALKDNSKPVFIAGDFNAVPESEVIKKISKNWNILIDPENPTIPSSNPKRCIDYIFAANYTDHKFELIKTAVEKEPGASDHLPVWTMIKIKQVR